MTGDAAGADERLALLQDASGDGLWEWDLRTGDVVFSPQWKAMLGYADQEVTGRVDEWRSRIHPDDVDTAVAAVEDCVVGRTPRVALDYRLRHRDGSYRYTFARGAVLRDTEGRPARFTGVHTDITDRIAAHRVLEHRFRALTRVAASQTFDQAMETTLDTVAAGVVEVTHAIACVVALIDEEQEPRVYRVVGIHGMPAEYGAAVEGAYRSGATLSSLEAYRTRRPVQRTVRGYIAADPHQVSVYHLVRDAAWDTVASVPLVYRDRALGAMSCSYPVGMEPDAEEIAFLLVVADQAAVAVQTARLFADDQGKAALEERQRLARELHDSVSQALFGIGLGARTARTLLDRDPAKAAEPLDYVVSLAEAGLTEMRALIFELRPDALETEGLVGLLEHQAAALRTRHALRVETDFGPEPVASLVVKEMLYRIAQEALHNTTKHAQARTVTLRVRQQPEGIVLEVADDGAGFDPAGSFPGHLGLRSMRERAVRQGATVEVESAPGHGTRTRVLLPATQ
jgi:PAS domain S-box-containing protein